MSNINVHKSVEHHLLTVISSSCSLFVVGFGFFPFVLDFLWVPSLWLKSGDLISSIVSQEAIWFMGSLLWTNVVNQSPCWMNFKFLSQSLNFLNFLPGSHQISGHSLGLITDNRLVEDTHIFRLSHQLFVCLQISNIFDLGQFGSSRVEDRLLN